MTDNNSNDFEYSSLQGSLVENAPAAQEYNFEPHEYFQNEQELVENRIVETQKKKSKGGFPKALIYLFASLIFAGALLVSVFIASDFFAELVKDTDFSFPTISSEGTSTPETITEEGEYTSLTDLAQEVKKSCVSILLNGSVSSESIGSGVIIAEESDLLYIVTCAHVVEDASNFSVRFDGESEDSIPAYLRGYDPDTDLAIIYVYKSAINAETLTHIKVATYGDSSQLSEGQTVMAITTPVSSAYANSVTVGVISCSLREVTLVNSDNVGTSYNVIQTDASINQGASGGGLFNTKGELIGICNATLIDVESEGIFFAFPTTPNKEILETLINVGKYVRPYIAITGTNATNWAYCATFDVTYGVYVVSVIDDGPAYKAGIQAGDIIIEFDGVKVETMSQLQQMVLNGSVDNSVKVKILRLNDNNTEMIEYTLDLTLGDKTNYYE